MVDIFDEVDEDVRRERMQAMAKRYGPILGLVVTLIIGGVAAFTFWKQYQADARLEAGAAFIVASDAIEADPAASAATFGDLVADGPAGYPVLASFKQAEALTAAGDRKGALDVLNGVEAMEAPVRYKHLARLQALSLRSYDEDPATLLPLYEELAASGAPWRAMALEQAGMIEWSLGREVDARKRFEAISADISAPVALRSRADAALTALREG